MIAPPIDQKTILSEGSLEGVGLHTGVICKLRFKPGKPGSGICFFKNSRRILFDDVDSDGRCTAVGKGEDRVQTVEHLFAALTGFGITDVAVEIQGPEIPILDGSALPFVEALKKLKLKKRENPEKPFKIEEPIFCYDKRKAIAAYPAPVLSVSYVLDYDHPVLREQKVDCVLTPEVFEKEVAPARTFCTEKEAEILKQKGFGKGADSNNTLVIGDHGPVGNRFRFEDECARHKVLDLIGDLALLGFPVIGRFIGLRSGHALNRRLVDQIRKQRGKNE